MSKPLGYEPIHESNVKKDLSYFLRIRQWGEGYVQVCGITLNGTSVEVVEGGFDTPLKKVRRGQVFLVPNGAGQFYEAAAESPRKEI